ncbi:WXG100 family type VII secretion target [Halobacillus faecis]
MSQNIRLTPDELREFARQYNTESSNVQELVSRLDGMSGQLQEIWEGASSQAFAAQYQELRPAFERMSTLLAEVSQQLNSTATTLEDTDQQIAGQIRG